ncbi:MAG: polyprenyl synthetase family protein [Paludibacteraceae bacterium]|nr:polyprenyl synthetase family protein [Paludibacteraceae bacterium]
MVNIDDIRQPVQTSFEQYKQAFAQVMRSDNPLLNEVLDYIRAKSGKQLRPLLVLLSAEISRGVTDKTILSAVALELLHTASLVHDDVVDSSPTRRGAKAVHAKWNNKVAVLVGDYMLARVINTIAEIRNTPILNIVSRLGAALSSGELLQLHANSTMWINEKQYFRIIDQKTAQLFAACTEAGAESCLATKKQKTALRNFGNHLGICFQLKDDIFDYSDAEDLGKPTMNDIRDGKATLPLIISLNRATPAEAAHIRQLAEDLIQGLVDPFEAEQEIKSFVLRYEGVRYANARMHEHKKRAIEALSVFRESPAKTALLALLEYAVNRDH